MEIKELRIGNIVTHPFSSFISGAFYIMDGKTIDIIFNDCKPINLNEDWLIKCGFKHVIGKDNVWDELKLSNFDEVWWIPGMYFIVKDCDSFVLYHCTDEDTYWQLTFKIKYVHQLQNIIFDLTNEELVVELN